MNYKQQSSRAFELDFLRGLAIIMMMLHHFIFDLRYLLGLDVFAWQESYLFIYWIRAPFVFIFLFVSGICCSFSKNNFLRSLKMGIVAILFSVVFFAVSIFTQSEMYVVINVLHLLTLGTLLYAILEFYEKKHAFRYVDMILLFTMLLFLWLAYPLSEIPAMDIPALIPVHEKFAAGLGMADYMPLVPWFGLFVFGAFFGRIYYKKRQTLFPGCPVPLRQISVPFEFVGRNALIFYLLHQPVLLGVLYFLRFLGIIG